MSDEDSVYDDNSNVSEESADDQGGFFEQTRFNKEIIITNPDDMILSQRLTDFEETRLINIRAEQIARDNICMVDVTGITNPVDMAKKELMMRKTPIRLRREVGVKKIGDDYFELYEDWNPNCMEFPTIYLQ